jgi:hypothetical protein
VIKAWNSAIPKGQHQNLDNTPTLTYKCTILSIYKVLLLCSGPDSKIQELKMVALSFWFSSSTRCLELPGTIKSYKIRQFLL